MSGPAPKPASERRRRNAPIANTVKLPAEGRKGTPPAWPFPGSLDERGKTIWADLWATPMAVAWERMRYTDIVARYVVLRQQVEALFATTGRMNGSVMQSLLSETRQIEDRLGLSPMAMLRLRWEVETEDGQVVRTPSRSVRMRVKATDAVARPQ